jgi:DNA-binding transcriptional LysR family regulator
MENLGHHLPAAVYEKQRQQIGEVFGRDGALHSRQRGAYLRRHGRPTTLESLQGHECIQFLLPSTGQIMPWLLWRAGVDFEHLTQGGICCSEAILGAVTLARHGAGLLQTYRFIVEEDLNRRSLLAVLPALSGASRPFSLLYPAQRHMPLRVRVLIDYLMATLGARPA